ncbi:MAG: ATP-binding protein [Lentisphaeraceae bacterium]|nr:ATP-binding protein [Lentisphaeraceae bacterium]
MRRKAENDLKSWLHEKPRKPLVIRGVRQVGKTWLVRHFARENNLQLLELNFEKDTALKQLFESNDPEEYISLLEMHLGQSIDIHNSLLFLDEIQAFPVMLAKLRWLYEDMPELAVIATGSLLDFTLADHTFSMPVGRVAYTHLEPVTFNEFLDADSKGMLLKYLKGLSIDDIRRGNTINPAIHKKLLELFKVYTLVGGMPEPLNTWLESRSFPAVAKIQQNLLTSYRDDFAKYAPRFEPDILDEVMKKIPRMLGQQIKYSNINGDVRSEVIKKAMNLLTTARICHKIYAASADGIPLGATINYRKFKTLFLDTGLTSASLGLQMDVEWKNTDLILVNKGAIAEQVTGQLLRTAQGAYSEPSLHYWARDKKGSEAEVDYLIQCGMNIVPIEVKSGSTGSMKSLHSLMSLKNLSHAIRINTDLPSLVEVKVKTTQSKKVNYTLLSLPIYMTDQAKILTQEMLELN